MEQEAREHDSMTFKLDRPPSNRAEMKEMRELKSTRSNPPTFEPSHTPWPKPPPRPNPNSVSIFYSTWNTMLISATNFCFKNHINVSFFFLINLSNSTFILTTKKLDLTII